MRGAAHALRQGDRHHRLRHRARHEGRRYRRPQDARAHRRHGALLRGRRHARPSRAARHEEPLRLGRRDRRLPHGCRRARAGRESVGAVRRRSHATCASGSAVCALMEGTRPVLVEVQALAAKRRLRHAAARGDAASIRADSRCCWPCSTSAAGFSCAQLDVFCNVVGGMRVQEPAVDLAVVAALASSVVRPPAAARAPSSSASSASAAKCARSRRPNGGWPRRRSWA